jgi:uncharacterized membrane protein
MTTSSFGGLWTATTLMLLLLMMLLTIDTMALWMILLVHHGHCMM